MVARVCPVARENRKSLVTYTYIVNEFVYCIYVFGCLFILYLCMCDIQGDICTLVRPAPTRLRSPRRYGENRQFVTTLYRYDGNGYFPRISVFPATVNRISNNLQKKLITIVSFKSWYDKYIYDLSKYNLISILQNTSKYYLPDECSMFRRWLNNHYKIVLEFVDFRIDKKN